MKELLKLIDTYVMACVELESENETYGTVDGSSVRYTDDCRNEMVNALKLLFKESERDSDV